MTDQDRILDGPQYDDDDIACDHCYVHGPHDGIDCPSCARIAVLKHAAILGLSTQITRLTAHNAVNYEELITDIKRAITFIRSNT